MTSNVGVRKLRDFGTGVGFETKSKQESMSQDQDAIIRSEIKKKFAPEFLNRIDSIVMFNNLDKESISKIVHIELKKVTQRVKDIEYNLEITPEGQEFIVKEGWDPNFGARPLKRAIQKWIEDPLTEYIIDNQPKKGSTLIVGFDTESQKIVVTKKQKSSK